MPKNEEKHLWFVCERESPRMESSDFYNGDFYINVNEFPFLAAFNDSTCSLLGWWLTDCVVGSRKETLQRLLTSMDIFESLLTSSEFLISLKNQQMSVEDVCVVKNNYFIWALHNFLLLIIKLERDDVGRDRKYHQQFVRKEWLMKCSLVIFSREYPRLAEDLLLSTY